jgi:hypothetical protein
VQLVADKLEITVPNEETIIYFKYKTGYENGYLECVCPCHFNNLTEESATTTITTDDHNKTYEINLRVIKKDKQTAILTGSMTAYDPGGTTLPYFP